MLSKGKQTTPNSEAMDFPKVSLAGRAVAFQTRLGSRQLYDLKNGKYLQLPDNFIARAVAPATFIGGTMDGNIFLEITEVPATFEHIPEKYCHDDTRLLLSAKKRNGELEHTLSGRYFEGKLRDEKIIAHLSLIKFADGPQYLLVLACKPAFPDLDLREMANKVLEAMLQ